MVLVTNTAPRFAAALASLGVWAEHPLLGAGLGLAPLHMIARFPSWAENWQEIIDGVDNKSPVLINSMSMIFRLLAEGGLIAFFIWGLVIFFHLPSPSIQTGAPIILLSLIGVFADALLIASFSMPYFWILLCFLKAMRNAP